jgi:acetoin utilization deacetylase AcuC-like enzyme
MSEQKAIFLHCDELEQFSYPEACPFDLSRAGRTATSARSMGLLEDSSVVKPDRLSRSEMEAYHEPAYLDVLELASKGILEEAGLNRGLGTPDCPAFDGLLEYASLAAGASVTGMRLLLDGKADICFNPSGGYHHAGKGFAAGFCYVNDIVLACLEAKQAGKRVLFLDIDVHHCDGVQNAFYTDKDVMTVSLHETGKTLFPGTGFEGETGKGEGAGFTVNVPLPVGTYDETYERAFREIAVKAVQRYEPDVIIIEAGMDALAGDPLAHLHLTNNTHAHIIDRMMQFEKPMLVTGGGGYNIENTVRGWALVWSVLAGDDSHDLMLGMGGVMMENTDWASGLRDRMLISDAGSRADVDAEIQRLIEYHSSM